MIESGMFPVSKELLPTKEAFIQAISVGVQEIGEIEKLKIDESIYILYNSNAPLTLEGNRKIFDKIICGTFYIVAIEKGVPRSLTDSEAYKYMDRFSKIEFFDDWDVINQYVDELYSDRKPQKYKYI